MSAAYPNWKADEYPNRFLDENGVAARDAWEKNLTITAKDMHDEKGNMLKNTEYPEISSVVTGRITLTCFSLGLCCLFILSNKIIVHPKHPIII